MLSTADATVYIAANVVSNEDWNEADEAKKQRLVNVADRTLTDFCEDRILTDKVTTYMLPSEAVYEFAAFLAIAFNDTNKLQQQGVAGFSVTGVSSFTFKENNVQSAVGQPIVELIPASVKRLIEKENNVKLTGRIVGWLV
jgi:hypothetical protein